MATKHRRTTRPSTPARKAAKSNSVSAKRRPVPKAVVSKAAVSKAAVPKAAASKPAVSRATGSRPTVSRATVSRKPAPAATRGPVKPGHSVPAERLRPQPRPRSAPVVAAPSAHDQAVDVFERGFTALQRRDFKEASALLSSILEAFPEEKELHERARVYIVVCERQAAAGNHAPKTFEERMNAATVAINSGSYEQALGLLRSLQREDGENDLVHYMLAVVQTGLGDADAAIPYLRQAVELNAENRYLAAQDADLEPLRQHPDFVALLDSAPSSRRRAVARVRHAR